MFENHSKCRIFLFWHFSPIFVHLELSGSTVWPQWDFFCDFQTLCYSKTSRLIFLLLDQFSVPLVLVKILETSLIYKKVYGCILICLGFLVYFGFTKDPFIMMLFWVSHSIIPSSNGSTCRRSARASWMQTFFLFRDDVVAEVSCLSLLMLRKFVTLLYDIFSIEKTSSQI